MTVYLLHFYQPVPRGRSKTGKPLTSSHYIGETDDLITRIDEHVQTTWERLEEPILLENGQKITGVKHGPGATFMGVVNSLGIDWKLAREWQGADREWERHLKNMKNAPKLCPDCNPNAHRYANKVFI
jgi:hypothetical protein